ncbi:Acetyltransferase (GNAT) domain-containing protein [Micromonospora echinaurantiaca]|uniref:Acetyltransferase (GNAT) domain-containing protein n=2 Tax=Micromonospora echinaurantiaca TaxID=47857 RepID=A0A1C5JCK1_9ACTN|nr:Acetyltransferase (GNAT) domain-containing protein [Micromonospora echinaurantiaca]
MKPDWSGRAAGDRLSGNGRPGAYRGGMSPTHRSTRSPSPVDVTAAPPTAPDAAPRLAGDAAELGLATGNAAALWTALAETRRHPVTRRPGFLAVHGDDRAGLRVLLRTPEPAADDLAEIAALVRERSAGPVTVEDPFGGADLTGSGLTPRNLPVMIRPPAPVPAPSLRVTPVDDPERLATVERVVVSGFPLSRLQPYRPGEAFPVALLDRPGVRFLLAEVDGVPAGACLTVRAEVAGLYWMTTLPEHRSRGVGRALLHAVLAELAGSPVTLTASRAGRPLYDSLGFRPVGRATWWS